MSNSEILREFLLETHENLALLDKDLIKLEQHPADKSTLAEVFRTLHSVKGAAGFLGLVKLQVIAHSAEYLLGRLRAEEMRYTPSVATLLLRVVDAIREILSCIESSGGEGDGDYSALAAEIDRLRESGGMGAIAAPVLHDSAVTLAAALPLSAPAPPESAVTTKPLASLPPPGLSQPPGSPVSLALETSKSFVAAGASETIDSVVAETTTTRSGSLADSAIRVDVGLLDRLMTLVGELVLARNQILQYCGSPDENHFLAAVQRLNLLTTELQASVMKTRMQPIGNVLSKFPRVVRDLAVACGKKVRLEMEGQETELDRSLIEAIRDPLTHLIRNAVDHGIEPPANRRAAGKSEEGRLRMIAYHEGGKVVIEVTDDGAGIDVIRVRDRALQNKLVAPDAVARMSPQEWLRMIFLPGFSTSDQVTQFSGRGVGMDVVRTNIEKIGGTVDIETTAGQGTTIRTKIPLTLAIIPALIIASGGERFAIPQVNLQELVQLDPEHAANGIEHLHGVPVYRLRGTLLPLVFLDDQLRLAPTRATAELNIVVLQADDRPFGLVVDAVRDTEEIVVKPLQKQLKGISVFAGAAIMGDGQVALVLDVVGLAHRAGVLAGGRSHTLSELEAPREAMTRETNLLLLFASREGGQMAIPLSKVARLEEFPRGQFEQVGARPVARYRGEILPLLDISQELQALRQGDRDAPVVSRDPRPWSADPLGENPDDLIPVIVCADGDQRVGLIVHQILDIIDAPAAQAGAHSQGIFSTAIVQERVTEFVDVAVLIRQATQSRSPHWV